MSARRKTAAIPERTTPVVRLLSCRSCRRFIKPAEVTCPFCGVSVAEAFNAWAARKAELAAALASVDAIFAELAANAGRAEKPAVGGAPKAKPRTRKRRS